MFTLILEGWFFMMAVTHKPWIIDNPCTNRLHVLKRHWRTFPSAHAHRIRSVRARDTHFLFSARSCRTSEGSSEGALRHFVKLLRVLELSYIAYVISCPY